MAQARTAAQFPSVAPEAGHYESFYLKACHPDGGLGVWIRHTVLKRPGEVPTGSAWFTLFEPDGPVASKVTLPAPHVPEGAYLEAAGAVLEPGRARGAARSERLDAEWELEFSCDEPPLRTLPREWMYRAPLPRTKVLSPYPAARFRGWVRAGERRIELRDWPGMVGHNWGAEHAERWIWLHGAGFEDRPDAWLDVAIGRVRVGPLTLPWIANGALRLDGRTHRLGGLERVRSTRIAERPGRCDLQLPGAGIVVRGRVEAPPERFVGWVYASPDGHEHQVVNCSIAGMELTLEGDGLARQTLRTHGGAAYELGMRERDHGIPIQPFPDR